MEMTKEKPTSEEEMKEMLNETETGEEERKAYEVDKSLIACGIGQCKPKFARRLASVKAFTANVFFMQLVSIASTTYFVATYRTIEKRFGLRTVQTGIIRSASDIATTCLVIFVGYIADRAHKPRILGGMRALVALTLIFIFAGPYVYLPSETKFPEINTSDSNGTQASICHQTNVDAQCEEVTGREESGHNTAFYLFIIGSILLGIGQSSGVTAYPYIYQNISKADAAMHVGKYFKIMCNTHEKITLLTIAFIKKGYGYRGNKIQQVQEIITKGNVVFADFNRVDVCVHIEFYRLFY